MFDEKTIMQSECPVIESSTGPRGPVGATAFALSPTALAHTVASAPETMKRFLSHRTRVVCSVSDELCPHLVPYFLFACLGGLQAAEPWPGQAGPHRQTERHVLCVL